MIACPLPSWAAYPEFSPDDFQHACTQPGLKNKNASSIPESKIIIVPMSKLNVHQSVDKNPRRGSMKSFTLVFKYDKEQFI